MTDLHSPEYLNKQVLKLLHRVERLMVPANSLVASNIGSNILALTKKVKENKFIEEIKFAPLNLGTEEIKMSPLGAPLAQNRDSSDSSSDHNEKDKELIGRPRRVKWDSLIDSIVCAISDGNTSDFVVPPQVQSEIDTEKGCQEAEEAKLRGKTKLRLFQVRVGLCTIMHA